MNETQKLMLGVEALRMVYPQFSISHWSRYEIREDFKEQAKVVLEHANPTVSEVTGMKIPLSIKSSVDRWTKEGGSEREAPYGMIGKEAMIQAIFDDDLDIIDESLIGANVALYSIDNDLELGDAVSPETRTYIEFNVSNSPYRKQTRKERLADKLAVLRA